MARHYLKVTLDIKSPDSASAEWSIEEGKHLLGFVWVSSFILERSQTLSITIYLYYIHRFLQFPSLPENIPQCDERSLVAWLDQETTLTMDDRGMLKYRVMQGYTHTHTHWSIVRHMMVNNTGAHVSAYQIYIHIRSGHWPWTGTELGGASLRSHCVFFVFFWLKSK